MPVKLGASQPAESSEARIEIIPLIDIMFFLLAAFMLTSLSMIHRRSVPVNVPTSTTAVSDQLKHFCNLSVTQAGLIFLEQKPVSDPELVAALVAWHQTNSLLKVFIRGDREARHGDMLRALDLVRSAGIDKVSFEIKASAQTPKP